MGSTHAQGSGGIPSLADSFHTDEGASTGHLTTPPTDGEEEVLSIEQLEQLWSWNTPVPPTLKTCMHDMVSEQASREPNRLAVHSWDGDFTYHDVSTKSDRFAVYLQSIGVKSGTIVPLCFEKSRWTVVAVLGVMKAGGAFALMDPSQPEGRLRTIVQQTGAFVVVTSKVQEGLGQKIAPDGNVITLPQDQQPLVSESSLPKVAPETNLYIQFTSGSTGKPKGVMITHENYTSGAVPRGEAVGYKSHSRVLDFASYAFDVCIDCMLCTLPVGGCLCIPSDADRVNDLSGAIRKMNVNMAHMTPSVARVLDPDVIPSLEVLGLGGEAISAGDAARWARSTRVINAYGPSECTVGCAVNSDVGAESKRKANVSIGRGVGGSLWIVDPADHDRLVPIGAVGELLVEGPIVGPGYLGDPVKTSDVFINDPKWLLAGSERHEGRTGRLYKTGDLVRYDPDGTIVFIGRGDQQVKLRGQRIELAEIEYHMRHKLPPGSRVAAEVIKPGASGDPTLVAFIAERAGLVSETDNLLGSASSQVQDALAGMNDHLSIQLPIYMVPAAYIPLQTMPLLVSAKTDRKRLRELGASLSRKDLSSLAAMTVPRKEPSTDMEKKLAEIWVQVLGPDAVIGASDNFFSLGGDSLRAMKLVAQTRSQGISLTVADILGNPTLVDMAIVAKPCAGEANAEIPPFSLLGAWSELPARSECASLCDIEPSTIEDIYPCTPLQEGLMALSAKISEAYVAQRVVELPDDESARKLLSAFRVASVDCPILRTRIVQVPEYGLMQVVVKDDFDCDITSKSLNTYLSQDRQRSVQLGKPLVRYGVVTDEATEKIHFVLTMHHALYDGWSMPLIVERVNRAYNNITTDRPAEFKHFISYLGSMDREASEAYWRERLEGASGEQFPALPYPGYQQQADSLLEHYVKTDRPSLGMTLATTIRAAWALLVSTYTATDDVVFGETLTGRNAPIPGVEQIEGPMIATIPVRVAVDQQSTVSEYLRRIHEQSVLGIPHEHFGLQHIRRLSPDAREACELRTGLVMHPNAETADSPADKQPADGFVPAGDAEAAQEALKFNTYALMLVCSLDPQGFLIMASFDSKTVSSPQMERMLSQLGWLTQQLIENPEARCNEIQLLTNEERTELLRLSRVGAKSWTEHDVTETWIVDAADKERLLPIGAVGELIVQGSESMNLERITQPKWAGENHGGNTYRTKKLAKYTLDGAIALVDRNEKQLAAAQTSKRTERLSATSAKQKQLQQTWSRILGIGEDEIALNDSFFQLGGDSIGAMKLVSELRAKALELTVPEIFRHRTLYEMAKVLKEAKQTATREESANTPFSLLDVPDVKAFVSGTIRPQLPEGCEIQDVLPARPLQQVAVRGTVQLPRFSARYEMFHFESPVDEERLFKSCQELVARNEILRTVFVETEGRCFGVVLESLPVAIEQYEIEGDVDSFAHKICDVDVQTKMPLGTSFVKFIFVRGENNKSCLILRISHAQYDEICLVGLLRQLAGLYRGGPVPDSVPFSSFVYHVAEKSIPRSIPYWRELLRGSSLTRLRPGLPLTNHKRPAAITRTVDISARLRDVTIATLPTAAWALCLARRLALRDVVFGEVVSGRNIDDLPRADAVMGPTWQYVPVRVRFEPGWKAIDLLQHVQHQHIASAAHESMSLTEIVEECTDWPDSVDWFDSVVHQDVYHVEELKFGDGDVDCRLETVYPHLEPLREWKVQAFVKGGEMTLEIVTFEEWIGVAGELLDELEGIMGMLVRRPGEDLF